MEKNRVCTICNRRFANGKAMGGHMRSHFAKLPLPPRQPYVQPESAPPPALSSSSLHRDGKDVALKDFSGSLKLYHPHDPCANSESSFVASTDPALPDKGSEAESQRNPKGRRSSRRCKPARAETSEQVSSASETFSVEDVALCLMMLLRDSWTRKGKEVVQELVDESAEEDEKDNEDDGDDDDDESFSATQANHPHHPKYWCETCNKVFKSYQAYGGHKASHSHKRMKMLEDIEKEGVDGGAKTKALTDQRLFKCPFCDKVFNSGQGLGGHKKVHFLNSAVSKSNNNNNDNDAKNKVGECRLDLNLPPSTEEEGSHEPVESSPVSSH
ncbi:zinc finger protein ZAT9-like [Syzygium oleosum]|uniref:zinc finger protein ZAT9-like n=1 Tax=Syzygium oleosum TaxID=219896 RepID=UPI0024B9B8EB|nr:zinc finger protein ZAT9-like [Syzygium oleosum]